MIIESTSCIHRRHIILRLDNHEARVYSKHRLEMPSTALLPLPSVLSLRLQELADRSVSTGPEKVVLEHLYHHGAMFHRHDLIRTAIKLYEAKGTGANSSTSFLHTTTPSTIAGRFGEPLTF
ncbi:hypothetical protein EI94DRAFT_555066 [Lactarius quietus]|nr:hypothetical protein EI94DRAFT_555066 [Lactarius quietus]